MEKNWREIRHAELVERESKIFNRRDEIEKRLNNITGVKLSGLQLLQLRQAIADYEQCEDAISRVQESMDNLRERV